MSIWSTEKFSGRFSTLPGTFLVMLDRVFLELFKRSPRLIQCQREFIDATAANVDRVLPDGNKSDSIDYFFEKVDVGVNTVTISGFGTQTIDGSSSVLGAQYDRVYVIWDQTQQMWHVQ